MQISMLIFVQNININIHYFSNNLVIHLQHILRFMHNYWLPAQVTNEDITITIVLAVFIIIYILRSHFRPAKCSITRIPTYLNIVLTGGSTGIGKSLLKKLVQYPCEISVIDIDQKQFQKTFEEIQKYKNKKCYIKFIKADLGDPKSIQDAIKEMNFGNVNILINNAGILAPKSRMLNSQGIQMQMAVNYLGHCRMIFGLLSKLQASREFKIINIGSSAHKYPPLSFKEVEIDFKDFENVRNNYSPFMSYSKSKLCLAGFTVMMGYELQMRNIRGKIIYAHPGFARSSIGRYQLSGFKKLLFYLVYPLFYTIISRSCDESADTILYLILQKYDSIKNGAYYTDNKIDTYSTKATDKDFQKQLWKKTLSYVKGSEDWKLQDDQQKSI